MAFTTPEIDLEAPVSVPAAGAAYLDQTDATTYFANSFNAAAWTALTAAEKDTALAEATRWLETLCWKGEKCDPAQPLAWPRKIDGTGCCAAVTCTTLPPALIQAVAELALALHQNKTAIIGGVASGGAALPVKRQKLGDLEVEYHAPTAGTVSTSTGRYGPNSPLILQRFPWLGDLLGECYMQGSYGNSRIIARVRS
jgi:hypothetical protein